MTKVIYYTDYSKVSVKQVMGHYEAYDANGNFICSGDTLTEVISDIESVMNLTDNRESI